MKNQKTIYITPQGEVKLKQELAELEKKRPTVVDEVQKARALGDLKENNAYHSNREKLRNIDRRILYLKGTLRFSEVVEKTNNHEIQLGSTVMVENQKIKTEYQIVGKDEADPKQKKISLESPLGKILIGKKSGDKIEYSSPLGKRKYTILEIS